MARGGAQVAIGIGQIIGGLLYSYYGGSYGGRGGGSYLIGSGIANVSGSKYGSARRGTTGFYQDLYGSLGAAGAQMGIGAARGGSAQAPSANYTPFLKDVLTQKTDYVTPSPEPSVAPFSGDYFGYNSDFTDPSRDNYVAQQQGTAGSHVFHGLRTALLGEYA